MFPNLIYIYMYICICIYILHTYTYIHIQTYITYSHIHALIWIDKDIYIMIYIYICTEHYMHPCVCIWFTAFCLATGAPLLCSLRHAQLVPYRPWAETNELNPPPKRTRLERPARTFGKWHQRMVLVGFSACKLEPSFRKHLKPFVPSC